MATVVKDMSNAGKELYKYKSKKYKPNSLIFDIESLNMFATFTMSRNASIKYSDYTQLKSLMDSLNMELYISEPLKMQYIRFINNALDGIVNKKLMGNRDMLYQYANKGNGEQHILDVVFNELSNSEVDYIISLISESLKSIFFYDCADSMIDVCHRFKTEAYSDRAKITLEFENLLDSVKNEFRRVNKDLASEVEFSLTQDFIKERIGEIYNNEVNPSRILLSGMQGLNRMNGGGFEAGRIYMLFGTAASGKSFTTLDLALQVKMYNQGYVCKDATKRPCIVILTMENSVQETISRMYAMLANRQMKESSYDDVVNTLCTDQHLVMSDTNNINIIVRYKSNLSIDTSYLYQLYDDLADDGLEPIMIIQDHIKRIRPVNSRKDLRLDLGEIVNEFKAFAVEKDLVMVSISHLNREATKIVEDARRSNKADIGKMLGRSNVSESMLMIDNCDVGYIITKETGHDMENYLSFLLIRTRTGYDLDYFCQPYKPGNDLKLEEDVGTMAKYKAGVDKVQNDSQMPERSYIANSDYVRDVKKMDIVDMSHDELMQDIKNRVGVNVVSPDSYDINGKYVGNLSGYGENIIQAPISQPKPSNSFFDRPEEPKVMRDAVIFFDIDGNTISADDYDRMVIAIR